MPLLIVREDITKMQVDAIVNPTNEEMVGLSGIDFAVHQKAGEKLACACRQLVPLGLGEAKLTRGYNLPAKYIVHTSGPVWRGGLSGERIILKSCYTASLELAYRHGCETVAVPLIASGHNGFPKDTVLRFAAAVIGEFLQTHEMTVYLCVLDRDSYAFSKALFSEICDFIDDKIAEECLTEENEADECMSMQAEPDCRERRMVYREAPAPCAAQSSADGKSLKEYMRSLDKSFAQKLFDLIDQKGMTDVECYKKANVDKKTFSKIKCHPDTYRPSKQTAVAFAIALELNLEETQNLLASAGLTLSRSFVFDKIIRYFIQKGIYDIFEINAALFEFDQVLLGC